MTSPSHRGKSVKKHRALLGEAQLKAFERIGHELAQGELGGCVHEMLLRLGRRGGLRDSMIPIHVGRSAS